MSPTPSSVDFGEAAVDVGPGFATLTLRRPEVANAINVALMGALKRALDFVEDHADSLPPVLVVRGAGGAFSAGIDLQDFPRGQAPDIHGFNRWERLVRRVERLPLATVALVQGACIGGGCQLALACDLRLVEEGAQLALPEVGQGFLPGMATWRLAKLVGGLTARRLVLRGDTLGAADALNVGLADAVAPRGTADVALQELVTSLGPVQQPAWHLARRLIDESFQFSYDDAIGHFLAAQHRAIGSDAFQARLAASADD